jgi:hypothetical protein
MEESMKLKKATYHLWTFTISKLISTFGVSVFSFGISFYILSVTGSATSFALVPSVAYFRGLVHYLRVIWQIISEKTIIIVARL